MLRFHKLLTTIFLLSLSMLTITASGQGEATANEELTVLFVPGIADPFYYSMERGARAKAEELEINFIVTPYPPLWDPDIQIKILNEAVSTNHYDAILIAPIDKSALIAPLNELYNQGYAIITVDTEIGNGNYTAPRDWSFPLTHIGTDNFAGGIRLAEELAAQVHEKGLVYVNTTTRETSTTEERKDGFIAGISKFPEMEVVRVDYNGDLQTVAMNQTLNALMEFPDMVAVFGTNVFSSQGVSAAVQNSGLSGAVRVAAWDATEPLIESLRNGGIDLVLAQKPAEMGALAVNWCYQHFINGKTIPKQITSGWEIITHSNINDPEMEQYFYKE